MIANLLEAHQRGQHQPPSCNPIARLLQVLIQLGDCGLIERRLLAGQMAEGFDLRLVGQIRDDVLVGFEFAEFVAKKRETLSALADGSASQADLVRPFNVSQAVGAALYPAISRLPR